MVYTANWGIIYHLPPIKGTRNNYWKKAFQLPNIHFVVRVKCEVLGSACLLEIGWYCNIKPEGPDSVFILIWGDSWKRVQVTCLRTTLCSANCWGVHLYKSEVAELFFCLQNLSWCFLVFQFVVHPGYHLRWQRLVKGSPIRPKLVPLSKKALVKAQVSHTCATS